MKYGTNDFEFSRFYMNYIVFEHEIKIMGYTYLSKY